MLNRTLAFALLTLALGFAPVFAQDPKLGSAAEAKALLEKAVKEIKTDPAKAIARFNSKTDGFQVKDLYVFCANAQGKLVAHADQARLGEDVRALKDPTGKEFGKEILDTAKENAVSTVSYQFPRPGGTQPAPKESYVTKVAGYTLGVGYYK